MAATPRTRAARTRLLLAPLALGLILGSLGCAYNRHHNMGATERWVASDINFVPKIAGTFFIATFDAIIGPGTMLVDQVFRRPQYAEKHKYFSYAGSRTIARSDMGHGYQWLAGFPTIIIDTVWLILTGPVDIAWVLLTGPSETPPSEVETLRERATR
jgi:hypothetical protein